MSAHTPSTPNLEYYRKQAKALLKSLQDGDPSASARLQAHAPGLNGDEPQLSHAQLMIARENGHASWPKFKEHIESLPASAAPEPPAAAAPMKNKIGDDAVKAKTGRDWAEWFEALDGAGAAMKSHQEIVKIVREQFGVGSWWQQMVTVTYEQARGLRSGNQSCAGDHQVSASKTINAPAVAVFNAWNDPEQRANWLPDEVSIRTATSPKSLRVNWPGGGIVAVGIYPKGEAKCSCTADHGKLPDAASVDRMRAHWTAALERLKAYLEG